MKNVSIDKFYQRINKRIKLASAYAEDNSLNFIIKACRLKPLSVFTSKITKSTKMENIWVDEYGHTLNIDKNGIHIKLNDIKIDKSKLIFNDLIVRDLNYCINNSSIAFVLCGNDIDSNQEFIELTFVNHDNVLKSFIKAFGEWEEVSSLCIGIGALKAVSASLNIKYHKDIALDVMPAIGCIKYDAWITGWPPKKLFVSMTENETIKQLTKELIQENG